MSVEEILSVESSAQDARNVISKKDSQRAAEVGLEAFPRKKNRQERETRTRESNSQGEDPSTHVKQPGMGNQALVRHAVREGTQVPVRRHLFD